MASMKKNVLKSKGEWPLVYEEGHLKDLKLRPNKYGRNDYKRVQNPLLVAGPTIEDNERHPTWASAAYTILVNNPKGPAMTLDCIFRTALEWIPKLANERNQENNQALRATLCRMSCFRQANPKKNDSQWRITEVAHKSAGAGVAPALSAQRAPGALAAPTPRLASANSDVDGASSSGSGSDELWSADANNGLSATPSPVERLLNKKREVEEEEEEEEEGLWSPLCEVEKASMVAVAEILVAISQSKESGFALGRKQNTGEADQRRSLIPDWKDRFANMDKKEQKETILVAEALTLLSS